MENKTVRNLENEKKIKKSLIKNSFWSFITSISARVGALFFTIILARFLMPENYGIYSIILSIVMVFYTFADLGIHNAVIRYFSSAISQNRKKVSSYYRYLLKLKLFLTLGISILLLLLAYPLSIYVFKKPGLLVPFFVASLYVFILSVEGFYTTIFYSMEKLKYASIRELFVQTLRIFLAFLVFAFVAVKYQIVGIFFALIITHLLIFFFVFYYSKRLLPELKDKPTEKINKNRLRKFIGYSTIASISGVFFSYIDVIMLGMFLAPEYIGYYRTAFSLVLGLTSFVAFPNVILLSIFTKINKLERGKVMNKVFYYAVILAIPISFGLLVLGKYLIALLYGHSYLPAYLPLAFLSFLIIPIVGVGIILPIFSAKEKPQIFAKLIIIVSIFNIILNLILIKSLSLISPLWAMTGAGIATLASWVLYFGLAIYFAKKNLHSTLSFKPVIKPLIASVMMFVFLLITKSFINDMNNLSGILIVILGILSYFIFMLLMNGIKKEDLNLIKILIRRDKDN